MNPTIRFLLDTVSRIGTSILAGSLVSCLVLGRLEPLHLWLMLSGVLLTGFGYPLRQGRAMPRQTEAK